MSLSEEDLLKKAKSGDIGAQRSLALLYELGLDRPPDPESAFRWWLKAAGAGDPLAQLTVADMYEQGEGTQTDEENAKFWREKAAAQNFYPWDTSRKTPTQPGSPGARILIIDDDESIREVLAARCLERKLDPILAASASQAFKKINENPDIALVVLDLMMPEVNGLQFLKTMRRMKILEGIPVLILSGKLVGSLIPELTRLSISGLYTKPVDQKLFEKIDSILQRKKQVYSS